MSSLAEVLLNTLNKDKQVREAAERSLNEACGHPDYVVSLLKAACETNNPREVRQAASIALKNGIKRNWTSPEEDERMRQRPESEQHRYNQLSGMYSIPQEARNIVRANILSGLSMVRSDNESLRRVLAECIGMMAEIDFPERWPSFIQEIVNMLSNVNDRDCVHNALLTLRRVVKRFEYKRRPRKSKEEADRKMKAKTGGVVVVKPNKREPLDLIVQATFPLMLQYGQKFVMMDDDHAGVLLRLIGKIFYSATRLELPPHLFDARISGEWFKLWEATINKPLSPSQSEGDDIDDISIRPWWKCKKCALEIAVRFFNQTMTDPLFVSDDDQVTKSFTLFFLDGGVAVSYLQAATKMLEDWARLNRPLPSIILQLLSLIHI